MKRQKISLWFFSINGSINPITSEESEFSKSISPFRSILYKRSRGCIRKVISNIFDIPALDVPLDAPIGKPPKINEDFGYISLSHCDDAILIGWSMEKIGVDIERYDRNIESSKIIKRFFSDNEKIKLLNLKGDNLDQEFIKTWVLKESAIKWQRGNIAKDISKWEISNNLKYANHNNLNLNLNTLQFKFKDWSLGVASLNDIDKIYPLLCFDG